ncbi:MAG: penicillin-binding protein 2 [Candidatus Krumholzibacteria bacterium]|nr:penicillin-binding protein 2 [Candidatus Krumholzibacteria bacterium]
MAAIDFQSERLLERRRTVLLTILVGAAAVIAAWLFHIQVFRHGHYRRLALSNRIQKEDVSAPRGLIRASDGTKLVVNIPVYEISVMPNAVVRQPSRFSLACRLLGVDEQRLSAALEEWRARYPDGREMTVVSAAQKGQISVLMENRGLFPFFRLVMKHRRQYPDSTLAAHLLGYTGEVTDAELGGAERFRRGDITGRTGIEFAYQDWLRGVDGVRIVEISAEGTRIGELGGSFEGQELEGFVESRPPVPGHDLFLTLDISLQRTVEAAFERERGCVVAMDPRNGSILAAVSRPSYDPNIFIGGVSAGDWQALNEDPAKPLFNRAVQATYPPGSTFKMVVAYAALRTGAVKPYDRLRPCYGGWQFGNRWFRCWRPEGHGSSNLFEGIIHSCDVYFYQLGERLEADDFAYAGRLFGFGRATGVDLPSEARGLLPDKAYYDRRFGRRRWTKGHLLNYSIGQGDLLATPVQLCQMTAMIANGGRRIRPHIVSRIEDSDGQIVYRFEEEAQRVPQIDADILSIIRRAMRDVVGGETGTGRAAAVRGVPVAGKTGTAQNPHGEDHALFVAYAPADDPVIALTIVLEHAGHGGAVAAPMARRILSEYFHPTGAAGGAR